MNEPITWTEYWGRPTTDPKALDGFSHTDLDAGTVANTILDRLGWTEGQTVLEIGCGAGMLAASLMPRIHPSCYTGCDMSAELISKHRELFPSHDVTVREAADAWPHKTFDFVILYSVSQYFPSTEYFHAVVKAMCNTARIAVYVGDVRHGTRDHLLVPSAELETSGWDALLMDPLYKFNAVRGYDAVLVKSDGEGVQSPLERCLEWKQACTEKTMNPQAFMDLWGNKRLVIGRAVADALTRLKLGRWFLDCGTLLGAHRTGSFIVKDDDFDIGFFHAGYTPAFGRWLCASLNVMFRYIYLCPYRCRYVDTYCEKLEVFDPRHGSYKLRGSYYNEFDYHYVSVDVQFYTADLCDPCKMRCLHSDNVRSEFNVSEILPIDVGGWGLYFKSSFF
jgi:SAM-dependent methyltransferase